METPIQLDDIWNVIYLKHGISISKLLGVVPLNYLIILGASHKGYNETFDIIGYFHGSHKYSILNIIYSIRVMNEFYISHQDVWRYTLICNLKENVSEYFDGDLGDKPII